MQVPILKMYFDIDTQYGIKSPYLSISISLPGYLNAVMRLAPYLNFPFINLHSLSLPIIYLNTWDEVDKVPPCIPRNSVCREICGYFDFERYEH